MPKQTFFFVRQFYTLYEQKTSNIRQILSISFPQGFQKPKKFGHLNSRSGSKNTFKKKCKKKLFLLRQFYTLYEQKFSNLQQLLDSEYLKKAWTLGLGKWKKKTVKRSEKVWQTDKKHKTQIQTFWLIERKGPESLFFFYCRKKLYFLSFSNWGD